MRVYSPPVLQRMPFVEMKQHLADFKPCKVFIVYDSRTAASALAALGTVYTCTCIHIASILFAARTVLNTLSLVVSLS